MIAIPPQNFTIRNFLVHHSQSYAYTFLSSSRNAVLDISIASKPPVVWAFNPATDFQNTGSNIFSGTLYKSVLQSYYRTQSFASGTIVNRTMYPTGSAFFYPSGSTFYVLSISSSVMGESITPSSFTMTAPLSTASFYDDGNGNILCTNPSSGYVGNIFYSAGVVILQSTSGTLPSSSIVSPQGLYLNTSSIVNINFDSSRTLYEYQTIATIGRGELNYSVNPSVHSTQAIGSGSVLSLFSSGTLRPYISTIGLYDDAGRLLAIAKPPRPIPRAVNSSQTFIIRWDI